MQYTQLIYSIVSFIVCEPLRWQFAEATFWFDGELINNTYLL